MTACAHESDVLDLVLMEQWPARATDSLRSHVDGCAVCRDLVAAVGAVVELRDSAARPPVPDAAIVWHRAQLRARQDAARKATQPMFAAQMAALTAFVAAGVLWIVTGAAGFEALWAWVIRADVWTTARWALYGVVACAVIGLIAFSVASFADDAPEENVPVRRS